MPTKTKKKSPNCLLYKQPVFKDSRNIIYELLTRTISDFFVILIFVSSPQYLNPASLTDPAIHDAEEFKVLEQSMDHVGLSGAEKADIFRVVAAVLHLGNITFEENSRDKKGRCGLTTLPWFLTVWVHPYHTYTPFLVASTSHTVA